MGTAVHSHALDLETDYQGRENCIEVLNQTRRDVIRSIHLGHFRAGADAVQTNSFGGSPITLAEFGLEASAHEINRLAGEIAREAAIEAVAHCRAGKGPYLLEVKTYRYRGHSMSDPGKYRTREEVQKMRSERDCIEGARHKLEALGVEEAEFKRIDDELKRIVQEAADYAQTSPEPDARELWTDILVEG